MRFLLCCALVLAAGCAHGGSWKSLFGGIGLDHDQQSWPVAKQWHWPDAVCIVLMDPADQSSFVLRGETIEGLADIDDAALESALLEGSADATSETEPIAKSARSIGGSVINWAYWCDRADPRPRAAERHGRPFEVRVRDPKGVVFAVPFERSALELQAHVSSAVR